MLEGIDGSGKTTIGKSIQKELKQMDKKSYFTCEPTNYQIGRIIRKVLSGEIESDPFIHALLFAADRYEHLEKYIWPRLRNGNIVITDRYVLASIAYQGAKGVDPDLIWKINMTLPNFLIPDLTILLDILPKDSLRRTTKRGKADAFEKAGYLYYNSVRNNYLNFFRKLVRKYESSNHHFEIVDATASLEEVIRDVKQLILHHYKMKFSDTKSLANV